MKPPLNRLSVRLPLSYAAIALLAAVSLGVVLLLTLQAYYARQEERYLGNNALAMGRVIGRIWASDEHSPPADVDHLLQSQVQSFAFLTQTRVQLLDPDGALLADSGDPRQLQASLSLSLQVSIGDSLQAFSQTVGLENASSMVIVEQGDSRFQSQTTVSGGQEDVLLPLSTLETPYSFAGGLDTADEPRSTRRLRHPVSGEDGRLFGYLELSQGPAYGRAIISDVTRGLLIAGAVAVLLAALAGWWASQGLIRPVQALSRATGQMAGGNLAVRAPVGGAEEIGRLAHSFNHMAGRIQQTVATLRNFVADAAHELNTPLTALRTELELASRQAADNPHLAAAQTQALRLQQLNDNLLQLSRLEAGLDKQEFVPIDLTSLLLDPAERYAARAEQQEQQFQLQLPENPVMVNGHETALLRAVDNLVDNALKFTPAGREISLSLERDQTWASLLVENGGIGIAEDEVEEIFGRFRRGRNAAAYPGSGLGLAIVQAIAEAHRGRVSLRSNSDGTIVTLKIPLTAT